MNDINEKSLDIRTTLSSLYCVLPAVKILEWIIHLKLPSTFTADRDWIKLSKFGMNGVKNFYISLNYLAKIIPPCFKVNVV